MEVLQELRNAIMGGHEVQLRDDNTVVVEGKIYPGLTQTAYRANAKQFYTIADIVYCYQTRSIALGKYLTSAVARKLQNVAVAHRDHVVKYLEGKAEADKNIDSTVRAVSAAIGGAAVAASSDTQGAQVAAEPAHALEVALRQELPYRTRYNVLDCANKSLKDDVFKHFFNLQQSQTGAGAAAVPAASTKRPAPSGPEDPRKRARPAPSADAVLANFKGTPIILVPPTTSSLINMFNAEEFFGRSSFGPVDPARPLSDKPLKCTITRTDSRGHTARFHITDNASMLAPTDWIKVVAVVAAGPEWQFKGWKWGQQPRKDSKGAVVEPEDVPPVKIFDRAQGFHFHYEGDAPHPNAARWSVTTLPLSRAKRYADGGVANRFWTLVDNDIYTRKPYLAPKTAATASASS